MFEATANLETYFEYTTMITYTFLQLYTMTT